MPPYIARTLPLAGSMATPPARTYVSTLRFFLSSLAVTWSLTALMNAFCLDFWRVVVMR